MLNHTSIIKARPVAFCRLAACAFLLLTAASAPSLRAQVKLDALETRDEKSLVAASREALTRLARDLTAQCPMEQQSGVRQDSLVYDAPGNTLVFHFTMDPQALPERGFYELKYNPTAMKEHIANAFTNADKKTQQILLLVKQAKGSLRYVFHRDTMAATATLNPAEVKQLSDDIAQGGTSTYRKRLQKAVDELNVQLPRRMNEGLTMDSARLDDAWMTYYCTADGQRYSLDMLAQSGRQSMEESIRSHASENALTLMNQLVAAHCGFRMIYHDIAQPSRTSKYTFTPAELKKML